MAGATLGTNDGVLTAADIARLEAMKQRMDSVRSARKSPGGFAVPGNANPRGYSQCMVFEAIEAIHEVGLFPTVAAIMKACGLSAGQVRGVLARGVDRTGYVRQTGIYGMVAHFELREVGRRWLRQYRFLTGGGPSE